MPRAVIMRARFSAPDHLAALIPKNFWVTTMHLLEQVAIFLLVAVLLVPLFQRLKLGAVLGYLAAGMLIGPWGLGVVSAVESTLQFAEFGVVLLLFLIGLELDPARLWTLRRTVFGLGGAQVAVTGVVIALTAIASGLTWQAALIVGLGGAMSSTALVISSLAERGQLLTRHGRESFAILLFQDLAVIPLLALLPLLAASPEHGGAHWMAAAKGIAAIAVVIAGSRLVVRPALKFIAGHSSREVFTAAALLLVVGSALIMEKIGLSMSLGAFLAGVFARRFRVPARARSRHRAVQRPVARAVLHCGRHERQSCAAIERAAHRVRARARADAGKVCSDVRDFTCDRRAQRHCAADRRRAFAGRRICVRAVLHRDRPRRVRPRDLAAAGDGGDPVDAACAVRVRRTRAPDDALDRTPQRARI